MKIAIFYHCFFYNGNPPELHPSTVPVVQSQLARLVKSGLYDAASEIVAGVNGGEESLDVARLVMPPKIKPVFHGLESRCENPTIVLLEQWLKNHTEEAFVLYFHAKSSGHDLASDYGKFDWRWQDCLMTHCVDNWRKCVSDLQYVEAVGCHWLTGQGHDHSQHYFAGTFFWARASFLRTLPSIFERERIKISGIASAGSKYEAEVWLGNGPRLPTIVDYHPGGISH